MLVFLAALSLSQPAARFEIELGTTVAAALRSYGSTLKASRSGFTISSYRVNGVAYREAQFTTRHGQVVWISLFATGQRTCTDLSEAMYRANGHPLEQDLIAEHSSAIWKLKGRRGYVSYTGLDSRDGDHSCWIINGLTRQSV